MSAPVGPLAVAHPWDLVASGYDHEIRPVFERYAEQALDHARVVSGQHVVDVATGPGTLAFRAAARGARVQALDFSSGMVARLQARLLDAPGAAIQVTQGDGQQLPFADGQFDAGFSMFGLMFFPDRERGWRELRRVVRPGGPCVVSSWWPVTSRPEMAALFASFAEAMPDLPGNDAPAPLSDPASIRAEVLAAGFQQVDVHEATHHLDFDSAEGFWEHMERSLAPLALLRERQGADWPRLAERLRSGLVKRLPSGPVRAVMPAWITVAL
jgi:ubiquinone/menaquinone biosynthesis C-methylase UbiE